MDQEPKRPRGRPRKFPSPGKNPTLSFRCRGDLYVNLLADAQENGRSISETIEHRLMASFGAETQEEMFRRVLGENFAPNWPPRADGIRRDILKVASN